LYNNTQTNIRTAKKVVHMSFYQDFYVFQPHI